MSDQATESQNAASTSLVARIEKRLNTGGQAFRERASAFSPRQQLGMLASVAVVLAAVGGMMWLALKPDMRVLLSGLTAQDAQQVEQELATAGISYDVAPDGTTIRVPANALNKARLEISGKGLPSSGRLGFAIFDKPNWVGSEFDERVNYQRALEGELEQTIGSLDAVQTARVHIVLPHDSLFTDEQRAAKASVVLKLRHRLSDDEAASIRNLVAGAVDTLRPDQVTLVDADGRQSFGPKTAEAQQAAYEQALEDKLMATLEPVAGEGNVRASVTAAFDSGTEDDLDETYDPTNVATLSMQRTETNSGGQTQPTGVPGVASNAPNVKAPVYPQQTSPVENARQESGTYAVSKHVRHHMEGTGRVQRITAAILINDRMVAGPNGKGVRWLARSPEEMHQLQQLAQAAIGFNTQRGDQVTVENLSFLANDGQPQPGLAERLLDRTGGPTQALRYGMLAIVFLLGLIFIVRPVLKQMQQWTSPIHTLAAGKQPAALAADAGEASLLDHTAELSTERKQARAQLLFDKVADYVRKEPVQSTRLLQNWLHTPGN
ncbi:MAG TPA: flagellar basal-body MS-ring/collar protein FliF [Acidobacteriaceae bacterium]|jgi:flagellar M-ring protein FliF|nr:flagellar basal-body MS-ring/collar protein FliF [Acidobacteriaceae bacterium]